MTQNVAQHQHETFAQFHAGRTTGVNVPQVGRVAALEFGSLGGGPLFKLWRLNTADDVVPILSFGRFQDHALIGMLPSVPRSESVHR